MNLPVVIIVGRPNVGKSSLFNCLACRRISIVEPTAGVTRDRIATQIEHNNKQFELLDTGGYGINDVDNLDDEISGQIDTAINMADLVLFVLDVADGVTPLDVQIAEKLRKISKPTILVVNKVDSSKQEPYVTEFFKVGMGEPFPISAVEKHGRIDLLSKITDSIHYDKVAAKRAEPCMKLAIVGRRNAGKSTLINTLVKEERVIVSNVAGTTRDSIDVKFNIGETEFLAIDTAGMRKRSSIKDSVEFYSKARTERSIRRADVVLFILDVSVSISQIEKKLGSYIQSELKPCIVVCNKWDLATNAKVPDFTAYIDSLLPGLSYAPVSFISALSKDNVIKTIGLAQDLFEQAKTRAPTMELNKFLEQTFAAHGPARRYGKGPKLYYATQVSVLPPTFVLFVNDDSFFDDDYARYLSNQLRKRFGFAEIPLKIIFRPKSDSRPRPKKRELECGDNPEEQEFGVRPEPWKRRSRVRAKPRRQESEYGSDSGKRESSTRHEPGIQQSRFSSKPRKQESESGSNHKKHELKGRPEARKQGAGFSSKPGKQDSKSRVRSKKPRS